MLRPGPGAGEWGPDKGEFGNGVSGADRLSWGSVGADVRLFGVWLHSRILVDRAMSVVFRGYLQLVSCGAGTNTAALAPGQQEKASH